MSLAINKAFLLKTRATPTETVDIGEAYFWLEGDTLKYKAGDNITRTLATGVSQEEVQDIVGAFVAGSGPISVNYDDANNILIISLVQSGINHANISGIGTNTHAQIDSHIASTSNPHAVTKSQVGLGNCDNTSDVNKPISTATQTALNGKAALVHTHDIADVNDLQNQLNSKENTIVPGVAAQYWRGNKTWATLDKGAVGLSNVDNTSDAAKPLSAAAITALNGKENLIATSTSDKYWRGDKFWAVLDKTAVGLSNVLNLDQSNPNNIAQSASFRFVTDTEKATWNAKEPAITLGDSTQYWRGDKTFQTLNKAAVGLGNVDNTTDLNKPISTATQTALNGKANTSIQIQAGTGLTGGGDLTASRTLSLGTSGAAAGTYKKPVMTIDTFGRVTSIRSAFWQFQENNTDASTNLTSFQTYLTMTVNLPQATDYKIEWTAIFRCSTNSNSPVVDILVNGTSLYNPEVASLEEVSDTATNERLIRSGFSIVGLIAGNNTIDVVYRAEGGATTVTMHYANLLCEEM